MKQDAEAHAEEDKKARELVDLKNQADQVVFQTRKQLEEHGEKVSPEIRGKIEASLSNVEEKIKGEDGEAIQAALTALNNDVQELGKAIYEASAAEGGQAGGEGSAESAGGDDSSNDDDVIDAEYEVKN